MTPTSGIRLMAVKRQSVTRHLCVLGLTRPRSAKGRANSLVRRSAFGAIRLSNFHFRIEPVSPAYIFGIQIVPVTVVTKYANAIPISLFVC